MLHFSRNLTPQPQEQNQGKMFESRAQNASAQVTEINRFWNRSWSSRTRYHPRNNPKTFRSTVNLYKSWLQHCVTAPLPVPIRQCFRNPRGRWAHERKWGRALLTLLGKLSRLVIAIPEQQGNLFCFIHSIFPNREWFKPRAHFWLPARECTRPMLEITRSMHPYM